LPDEQALLGAQLRAAPGLYRQEQARPATAGWSVTASRLQLGQGLAYQLQVDDNVLQLVARCRGDRTLGTILTDLAASLGQEPGQVIPAGLDLARCLLEHGFLVPVAEEVVELSGRASDEPEPSGLWLHGEEIPDLATRGVEDFFMIPRAEFQV
jgi:hypothetical protein